MLALITGASSGIGRDIARELSNKGYDLILVARNKKKLEELKKELNTKVTIHICDLSSTYNIMKLYNKVKKEDIDILINNAGFGVCGLFEETSIDKELDMIDVNIKGMHTMLKLFYKDFKEKDRGYILNVASSAAFLPSPVMASYYASKAYVLRLTEALYEELRHDKSNVYIGALCPGPVSTNFNDVANVKFASKPLSSEYVAKYAVDKMFKRKLVIIPGFSMKITFIIEHLLPHKLLMRFAYHFQKSKIKQ